MREKRPARREFLRNGTALRAAHLECLQRRPGQQAPPSADDQRRAGGEIGYGARSSTPPRSASHTEAAPRPTTSASLHVASPLQDQAGHHAVLPPYYATTRGSFLPDIDSCEAHAELIHGWWIAL